MCDVWKVFVNQHKREGNLLPHNTVLIDNFCLFFYFLASLYKGILRLLEQRLEPEICLEETTLALPTLQDNRRIPAPLPCSWTWESVSLVSSFPSEENPKVLLSWLSRKFLVQPWVAVNTRLVNSSFHHHVYSFIHLFFQQVEPYPRLCTGQKKMGQTWSQPVKHSSV